MLTKEQLLAMTPDQRKALGNVSMKKDTNSNCADCAGCKGCTDCKGCMECMDCTYCNDCAGCTGCTSCTGCKDCTDCTGITGGRKLQYVAYGIQLTKEEYESLK